MGPWGTWLTGCYQGYVTDFISVLDIPVFNLADLSVLVGFLLLFIDLWRKEQRKSSKHSPAKSGEELRDEDQSGRNLASFTSLEAARRG